MATARGKLIVIEGIDGSGKTTQEERIAADLSREKLDFVLTKQPTDWYRNNPIVRRYLDKGSSDCRIETIGLVAAADRMLHIDTFIEPALASGTHVICNRYVYSTYAYFEARGADSAFIAAVNSRVPVPDCGILLQIDPSATVQRIRDRDGDSLKFEERDSGYLAIVQEHLLRNWPDSFCVADGSLPVEDVYATIRRYLVNNNVLPG